MFPPISALHLRLVRLFPFPLDADLMLKLASLQKDSVRTSQVQCQEAAGPGHHSFGYQLGPGACSLALFIHM